MRLAKCNDSNRFGNDALPQHSDLNWELQLRQVLACNWMRLEEFIFISPHLLSSSVTYLYISELSSYSFLTPAHLQRDIVAACCCSYSHLKTLPVALPLTPPFQLFLFPLFNLISHLIFLLLLYFLVAHFSFFITAAQVTAVVTHKSKSPLFCHTLCVSHSSQ